MPSRIPGRTRVVCFTAQQKVEWVDADVPQPGPDDVLIETSRTLISTGTETTVLNQRFSATSHWANYGRLPHFPGYSAAGRVIAVGENVTRFAPGDRVTTWGLHGQIVRGPISRTAAIPDDVSDDEAVWASLVAITQHGFRRSPAELGEVVVVVGLGLLGQLVVQWARLAGAGEIIAIDPAEARLGFARKGGATHTLPIPAGEAVAEVEKITGGQLADVVFDMTGHPQVFADCQHLLRIFGRLVLIGDPGEPEKQCLTPHFINRNLRLYGAHQNPSLLCEWNPVRMIELFFKLLRRKQIDVASLITHRFPAEQAGEAYHLLNTQRERMMGVVLEFKT